jgi:hypothetical protein
MPVIKILCNWKTGNYPDKSTMRFNININIYGEPRSSGSIVSGYGLDDRAIEVRSPAEAGGFFL